ncbi:nitroreductase family protein [Saccharopolyspora sp. HNM0983]|uniref:Nitroreductase family protein n=1 Tax=Saccharopolyspora montiporae TaxID=2781240 RepID=A0A929BC58_9PSEU|nr:nitroreductase family protein [Saccharopolyspora sp. HNM0983]MBE9375326.1 nitroreductase family protein [Saccharopolyspora sp. HNM0983]
MDGPAPADGGGLTCRQLLTTTRSVRRRLDLRTPVDLDLVRDSLRISAQAPNGSNDQPWHWVLVTDPDTRRALAECYRSAARPYLDVMAEQARSDPARTGVWQASEHLAEHLHEVPVLLVPCLVVAPEDFADRFRALGYPEPVEHAAHSVYYGSIWPAIWSAMLALRSNGLASSVTSLHLNRSDEAAEVLGLPDHVRQAALLAVAHPLGSRFHPAPRRPIEDVLHHDRW